MEDDRVLLVGYPKSGNTWLGYMLSYILNAQYVEPYDWLLGLAHDSDERILALTSGGLNHTTKYKSVIKSHSFPPNSRLHKERAPLTSKIMLIVRDPRDVAVSFYFYHMNVVGLRLGDGSSLPLFFKNALRHRHFYRTFLRWEKHTAAWMNVNPFIIKYEGLLINPEIELKRILDFLGEEKGENNIRRATELFGFNKLKSANEHSQRFYRKGVAGDYREHFTTVDYLAYRVTCQGLAEKIGYRS